MEQKRCTRCNGTGIDRVVGAFEQPCRCRTERFVQPSSAVVFLKRKKDVTFEHPPAFSTYPDDLDEPTKKKRAPYPGTEAEVGAPVQASFEDRIGQLGRELEEASDTHRSLVKENVRLRNELALYTKPPPLCEARFRGSRCTLPGGHGNDDVHRNVDGFTWFEMMKEDKGCCGEVPARSGMVEAVDPGYTTDHDA